mmetsp:Transcript_16732/g.26284  ORF Transcript_16732/g.26284 Transcript_16732/m.26284 type:complete len:232 (-) Transcript_16732:268-963(-)
MMCVCAYKPTTIALCTKSRGHIVDSCFLAVVGYPRQHIPFSYLLVITTIPRCAHGTTRRIIRHHRLHPIIPLVRIKLSHLTVPRLDIPTNLHPTKLLIPHLLHGLTTSHIPRRVPHGLGQMSIPIPPPKLLIIHKSLRDLIRGVLQTPIPTPLVLREVLALQTYRIVQYPHGIARIQQCLGVHLGILGQCGTPLEMPIRLLTILPIVTPSMPIPPPVIMSPPPFAITFIHG